MEYYIVMNEWNYPHEQGREFIGDFDSIYDAEFATKCECSKEKHTFLKANDNKIDNDKLGDLVDAQCNCGGYILVSGEYFFRSVIIERKV